VASEAVFRTFFNHAPDMMCIVSADGRFEHVNRAVEGLGYSADDLLSLPLLEFVHPEDRAATALELAKVAKGEPSIGYENRYRCKDGSHRWLSWTSRLVGERHIVAIARDVSGAKHAEASMHQANQFLDAIVENIPNMVFVKGAERLEFVRFNRAGEGCGPKARSMLEPLSTLRLGAWSESQCLEPQMRRSFCSSRTIRETRNSRFGHS